MWLKEISFYRSPIVWLLIRPSLELPVNAARIQLLSEGVT